MNDKIKERPAARYDGPAILQDEPDPLHILRFGPDAAMLDPNPITHHVKQFGGLGSRCVCGFHERPISKNRFNKNNNLACEKPRYTPSALLYIHLKRCLLNVRVIVRVSNKLGLTSFACGTFAVLLAFVASYAYAIRDWSSWFVFDFVEYFGLVKQSSPAEAEVKSFNIFSINESNAITWTFLTAMSLAAISILAALRAEARSEDSLYLSGGFMCATLSIILLDRWWGIATLTTGFVAIILVRTRCRKP